MSFFPHRLASLRITLHLLTRCYKDVEERVADVFKAVHGIILQVLVLYYCTKYWFIISDD